MRIRNRKGLPEGRTGYRSGPQDRRQVLSNPARAGAGQLSDKLGDYRSKRDFGETPEPGPQEVAGGGNSFVIQKHNASSLHYDFRLERDGVLVSWAVPKGLPVEKGVKRLAVQTEDHPLEYGSFEGEIPKGNYGAGEVKIFDHGTFEAPEWTEGKITVRLEGNRHRGEYHLVRTKQSWLVFMASSSEGLQAPPPPEFQPMLAEAGHDAFDDPQWRFEPKMDGIRTLAYITTDATVLKSRTGKDQTDRYPELAHLAHNVNALSAVLDGEIVALEPDGRPSFELLQQRMNIASRREVERMRRKIPATIFLFDVLWYDGEQTTGLPLEERRGILEEMVTEAGAVKLTYFLDGEGKKFFEASKGLGLEGVIAKKLGSTYLPGKRIGTWRKIKAVQRLDCLIIGWNPGAGGRSKTLGSLILGAYREGELIFIGQVGTGFTNAVLADLAKRLLEIEVPEPPSDDEAVAEIKHAHWVRPELVCEVEYLEFTKASKLRAPSYKGLRPDKTAEHCVLP